MKIKTNELIGPALDWTVALCGGQEHRNLYGHVVLEFVPKYSTDWSHGGPIIEREGINVGRYEWMGPSMEVISWSAERYATEKPGKQIGPTPLIAAMRCYVATKLGDEVEIPDELG